MAHTLNHHRSQQPRFATVCARDRAQAVAGLRALAAGQSAPRGGRPALGGVPAGHGVRLLRAGLAVGGDGPAVAGR